MTVVEIQEALEKMRATLPSLRAFRRAAIAGTILPTGGALDTYLPTFAYIAIVSLLDDALEAVIDARYPATVLSKLANRIEFLEARGQLADAPSLQAVREARNRYAHEHGNYATWDDVQSLLAIVHAELLHLGILVK